MSLSKFSAAVLDTTHIMDTDTSHKEAAFTRKAA
jgi:hypothetical protein